MTELGPESRRLIDEERLLDEPTPDELESRRRAVFASLGLPLPTVPEATVPPELPIANEAASAAGTGAGAGTKLAIALGIATISTIGYLALRPPDHADSPTTPVASSPSVDSVIVAPPAVPESPSLPPSEPPVVAPQPVRREVRAIEPERVDPSVVAIENHETPPEPLGSDSLSEESMLVAAAEAQLRAGHGSEALSLFDRALARHPTGSLRAEAISGRVASLCRLGRTEEGRRELERFLASYPRSPSAPRLRTACGVEP